MAIIIKFVLAYSKKYTFDDVTHNYHIFVRVVSLQVSFSIFWCSEELQDDEP